MVTGEELKGLKVGDVVCVTVEKQKNLRPVERPRNTQTIRDR
jgi:hypothetical protein